MPSSYWYSRLSDVIVIGSFDLVAFSVRNPVDWFAPDAAAAPVCAGASAVGAVAGSATAARASASDTNATTAGPSPPIVRRSRRLLRIVPQHGVDLAEQPHALRRHVDLHAEPADVERLAANGHDARRGDPVRRVVVARLLGAELELVELEDHVTGDRDRSELLPVEREPALGADELGVPVLAVEMERHPGPADDHLLVVVRVLRVVRLHFPHRLAVLHLDATKVLDVLCDVREKVRAQIRDGPRLLRAHVLPRRDADPRERRGHDGEQRHS